MSSSPFEIFRRNLKPMMVLLTGLAMFAFVVLPVLDTYMRRGSTGGADQVVAEFDGVKLTRSRVEYLTRNHQSTIRFLRELAENTISRGGVPRTAGFQYDAQNKRIDAIGINEFPSARSTIRTAQFAARAGAAGFMLDDVAVESWLQQYTDGMFSDGEIVGLLMESTRNQMGRPHLYEQLRYQLLSGLYLRGAYATLSDGRMPMLTPAEQWDTFLKLNQQANVDAYGVLVNDYLPQTNETPGEAEIAAVYEEGKDRDSSDQSPDPAFHRRYSAKFEYLVGNYQTFLDAEVEKLDEEKIRAEYDRRLKGGDFQMPADALIETETSESEKVEGDSAVSEAKEDPPESGKPEAADSDDEAAKTDDGSDDSQTDAEPAKETAEETEPAEKEADAADGSEDQETKQEEAEEDSAEAADEEKPSSETDQSSLIDVDAVRLVALQEQEDAAKDDSEDAADDAEKTPEPASDSKPDAEVTPDDSQENNQEDAAAAKEESKPEETETADSPKDDQKSGEAADSEAKDESADDGEKPSEEPKVKSFEEVRDQIAEDLAGPDARRKMDAAVTEVTSAMKLYFNKKAIHDSNVSIGQGGEPPVKPDLAALAKKLGLEHQKSIGPYTQVTINDEPIAESFEVGSQLMQRGPGFGLMMFGFDNGRGQQIPRQQLFSPLRTADDQTGKIYVSWKIEEKEAHTPTLDEVRDEVILAIRTQEARKLALEAAQQLAEKAADGTPLADLVPEDKKENLQEGLGPFSWLDSFGFQGATIGNVPQLDSVGTKFMKTVFESEVGSYGVAMNQPERVVYVVKPSKFEPSMDELQQRFKQPTNRMMALIVGGGDTDSIIQGFYESMDERTGFATSIEE